MFVGERPCRGGTRAIDQDEHRAGDFGVRRARTDRAAYDLPGRGRGDRDQDSASKQEPADNKTTTAVRSHDRNPRGRRGLLEDSRPRSTRQGSRR